MECQNTLQDQDMIPQNVLQNDGTIFKTTTKIISDNMGNVHQKHMLQNGIAYGKVKNEYYGEQSSKKIGMKRESSIANKRNVHQKWITTSTTLQ